MTENYLRTSTLNFLLFSVSYFLAFSCHTTPLMSLSIPSHSPPLTFTLQYYSHLFCTTWTSYPFLHPFLLFPFSLFLPLSSSPFILHPRLPLHLFSAQFQTWAHNAAPSLSRSLSLFVSRTDDISARVCYCGNGAMSLIAWLQMCVWECVGVKVRHCHTQMQMRGRTFAEFKAWI